MDRTHAALRVRLSGARNHNGNGTDKAQNQPANLSKGGLLRRMLLVWVGVLGLGIVGWTAGAQAQPQAVTSVTAIAAGGYHSCALTGDGAVNCWGQALYGQVGDGTRGDANNQRLSPVRVSGLDSGIIALAAGNWHSCALTAGGGVTCWGANDRGQVGDGTRGDAHGLRLTPVNVTGLDSGVTAIAAGSIHTCALTTGGGVKCWGHNQYGQLGDGGGGVACGPSTSNLCRLTPVDVVGLDNAIAIAAGNWHTCALTEEGAVKCWGHNQYGQLGDNTTINHSTPVQATGLTSGATDVAGGIYHTCAVINGGIQCWGRNDRGQLGDGTTTDHLVPFAATGLTGGVASVTAGHSHTCALLTGGGVKCWGWNLRGQVGDGTRGDENDVRLSPVDVVDLSGGVSTIDAGYMHTCALITDGLKCWGANDYGQLGDGTGGGGEDMELSPIDVPAEELLPPAPNRVYLPAALE